MYVLRRMGVWHWWGLAPAPVARAIAIGGATAVGGPAAGAAVSQVAGSVIKDKPKASPQATGQSGSWFGSLSQKEKVFGAAGAGAVLLLLLKR